MKKIKLFALLLALTLILPTHGVQGAEAETLDISSPYVVLIERDTGTVLYEKNAHDRGVPASVTKVMTLLLIAEYIDGGHISKDDIVTASANAASMGGSQIWLEEGEQMSVSDMVKCIAIVSANDCAVAMAEYIAGSEEAFVLKMNERAAELGLENTSFSNCTGLFESPEHYTSAYDIAIMSAELLKHEWIKEYTSTWTDSIRDGEFELSNTNKLVSYYEGITGLKTGFTSTAMYCVSASAMRDGMELIAVIMHGESIESRNHDAVTLLDYGFANYALCPLTQEQDLYPVQVNLGKTGSVNVRYEGDSSVLMSKNALASVSYETVIADSIDAPVAEGQAVGSVKVLLNGELMAEIPIVADSSIERLTRLDIFLELMALLISS